MDVPYLSVSGQLTARLTLHHSIPWSRSVQCCMFFLSIAHSPQSCDLQFNIFFYCREYFQLNFCNNLVFMQSILYNNIGTYAKLSNNKIGSVFNTTLFVF